MSETPVEDAQKKAADVKKEQTERLKRKMYPSLSRLEMLIYLIGWVGSIVYTSYHVHIFGKSREKVYFNARIIKHYNPSWLPFSYLHRDGTDSEWTVFKYIWSHKILPLALLYPFLSQVVKKHMSRWAFLFAAVYSVSYSVLLIGVKPVILLFVQIIVIFCSYLLSNHAGVVWAVTMGYGQIKDKYMDDFINLNIFDDGDRWSHYLTHITHAWISCRCVSFCLDRVWGKVEREESIPTAFVNLTAFCFYLPLGIMGPLITSAQFSTALNKSTNFDRNYLTFLVKQSLRFLFWFVVIELFLCFFYQNLISRYTGEVEAMNMWAVSGLGYLMGQYFQLKYVMMYGTASFLARLDDVDAPREPICIARVHLYSDMWRNFDAGLHKFMHTYIYIPLVQRTTYKIAKILISIIIFAFIYVWHGTYDFVLIWSVLNCLGVLAEGLARELGRNQTYADWELGLFGLVGQRRLHAAFGAPLFLMSCLSNFYFFAGKEVGGLIAYRTFHDTWPIGFPFLLFVMYCGSQVSIEVKNRELRSEMKKLE